TGTQANVDGIPVAGKTGSTNIPQEVKAEYGLGNGVIDSWFSGYTTEYSLAVWTGYPSLKNKDGDIQYIRYDGSQDIAKQLFQRLMSEISDLDTPDFEKPDSVISKGSELYVKGEEPEQQQPDPEKSAEPDTADQEQEKQEKAQEKEEEQQEEDKQDAEEPDKSEVDQEKQDEEPVEEENQEEEEDAEESDTSDQEQDQQDEEPVKEEEQEDKN